MFDTFKFDLLDLNENAEVVKVGEKTIYNTDQKDECSEWLRETNKGKKIIDNIQLKSALKPGQSNVNRIVENALAYILVKSNNVRSNDTNVALFSVASSNRGGISLDKDNFIRGCSVFAARKAIKGDWVNWYDEYLAPNEEHEQFEQFKYDSLVYSLFNSKSQQSSLRQVEYKDKLWDIKNEFFWMSADRMKELADENGYDELYNDARTASDRHVHNLLFGEERIYDKLSPDAKAVLDKATELVEKSMRMRQLMTDGENHLKAWDAGYAQLKLVWKEYHSDEFKEFRELYKALEERMRPLVYELGFLLK